jgi:hypothetical protein
MVMDDLPPAPRFTRLTSGGFVILTPQNPLGRVLQILESAMNDKEKPAIEKAVDKVNDLVEKITLKAADAGIEPDPKNIAGTTNEHIYLPEATETVALPNHSGRITPNYEYPAPNSGMIAPKKKKAAAKKTATKIAPKSPTKSATEIKSPTGRKAVVRKR